MAPESNEAGDSDLNSTLVIAVQKWYRDKLDCVITALDCI